MKQLLFVMTVVMGQSVLAADEKPLIADPIVKKAIRSPLSLNKPTGELTKAELERLVTVYLAFSSKITDSTPSRRGNGGWR